VETDLPRLVGKTSVKTEVMAKVCNKIYLLTLRQSKQSGI